MSIKNVFKGLALVTALAAGLHSTIAQAATTKQCDVPVSFQFSVNDFPCSSADRLQRALGRGAYTSTRAFSHAVKFLAGIGTSASASTALLDANGRRTLNTAALPCPIAGDRVIDGSYGPTGVCQLQSEFGVSTLRIAVR